MPYRLCVLLISIFFLGLSDNFIQGEGRFVEEAEDSSGLVKRMLVMAAFENVITRSLEEMNLNSGLFWENYNSKLQDNLESIKEKIEVRFGITDEGPQITAKKRKRYEKFLRKRTLNFKDQFFKSNKLNSVIRSYIIKERTHSSINPQVKYLKLEAKVNYQFLNSIYNSLILKDDYKRPIYLLISSNFDLLNTDWTALGVNTSEQITSLVSNHWQDNLGKKLEDIGLKVFTINDDFSRYLDSFVISHDGFLEQEMISDYSDFKLEDVQNSIWLKIGVCIEDVKENYVLRSKEFLFSHKLMAFDLRNKGPIISGQSLTSKYEYFFTDKVKFSGYVSSLVFRQVASQFHDIERVIKKLSLLKHTEIVHVKGYPNLDQVYALQKILQLKGSGLSLKVQIDSQTIEEITLRTEYQGGQDKFEKTLRNLDNTQLGNKIFIKYIKNSYPPTILLRKEVDENSNNEDRQNFVYFKI